MSQILSLDKLLSEDGVICDNKQHREEYGVVTSFIYCYRDTHDEGVDVVDMAVHDRLAFYLQQVVEKILKRAHDERLSPLAHLTIVEEFGRLKDIFITLEMYGLSTKTMAVQILPVLVQCMHCYPQVLVHPMHVHTRKKYPHCEGFVLIDIISKLRGEAFEVAEVQQCIVTNLICKIHNKNLLDITMDVQNTDISNQFDTHFIRRSNIYLSSFINIILQNPLLKRAFCIILLLETRLFDVLAMSNIATVHGNTIHMPEHPAYILNPILQILERKPYQRERGIIHISISSRDTFDVHGRYIKSADYRAEYPGVDCTSTLRTGMLEQICRRFNITDGWEIFEYSNKIYNIATALKAVLKCENSTNNNRDVCCKILALLMKTHEEIAHEIGLEWSASLTAPLGMLDRENTEANGLLANAVDQNPMLRNALVNGRLTFSASDWQEMSEKQALFVPVNSLVFQRGLSARGTVQIGSNFFQPIARGSMQNLLGCESVIPVLLHMWQMLNAVEEFETSKEGVMYCSLVFIKAMLDQMMDIECSTVVQKSLIDLLARILEKTFLDTVLCEITCHIMNQLTRKLDIPMYEDVSPESSALYQSTHVDTLFETKFLLFSILRTSMDTSLFRLLRSTPQSTEQQCRITFYACTILIDMYKMRAMKYSQSNRKQNVEFALTRTWQNIDNNTGFMTLELQDKLTSLRACYE